MEFGDIFKANHSPILPKLTTTRAMLDDLAEEL
jgi:hypothetical protein